MAVSSDSSDTGTRPTTGNWQAADAKKSFSLRFAFCIKQLGINHSEVARRTGIPKSNLSRFRNGETLPDPRQLFIMADLFEVDGRWLFSGDGSPGLTSSSGLFDPDNERDLLWYFRSIPPEHQTALISIARALAEANALDLGKTRASAAAAIARSHSQTLHTDRQSYTPQPEEFK